ncbi:MAG: hypothetical protein IT262_19020 [Saprospiraceae bacterium]|nr:hypothetical protein [Saprospiraceae bacterium]
MIYSFQQLTAILDYLQKEQIRTAIPFKYKLVKHLNHATSIYIFDETKQFKVDLSKIKVKVPIGNPEPDGEEINIDDPKMFPSIDIREVSIEDYNEDKDYYDIFFETASSFEGVTRRLDNAFGKYPPVNNSDLPPIVSFYSYKGGVGRTTALASVCSYHARRTGSKVLILDCDFEAPGLINFFGMDEDSLASKGGIVEYLTDSFYLPEGEAVDITQYIHTISAGASGDPLGYAGEKGTIYVMNAGNISIRNIASPNFAPTDLRTHQDHYLHGLARLDLGNSNYIVEQFQYLLKHACNTYHPDVILIDSRTGFNDVFSNIVLRLSDIVVGLFGTNKQNIPGLYNFLNTIIAENQNKNNSLEIVVLSSISSDAQQSFNDLKNQIEEYNRYTNNELIPEVWGIQYDQLMSKIGTPTDTESDILLRYTDPVRYAFTDYQNGKGDRFLEYLSQRIEKKNLHFEVPPDPNEQYAKLSVGRNVEPVSRLEILNPLRDFFVQQNELNYAENLDQIQKENFLNKYYYFRNYLRDLFLKEMFIVRGYKGTGKTLLYHALEESSFVEKLKKFCNISEDFRFVNIVDKANVLHLRSLDFNPENIREKGDVYYRRFWSVYIWNVLVQKFSDIYKSNIIHFDIMSDETTRKSIESYIKTEKILDIEHELRAINEILKTKNIKVVISFDYLDKIVETSEWNKDGHPISQLIKLGQFNPYSNLYLKIFIRTDLFHKIQYINNVRALENKVLSLDWTTDELFAYFFKVVYTQTSEKFINWLLFHNPDKPELVSFISKLFEQHDAQIPLEEKEQLVFLVDNFFGENIFHNTPNFGKSYTWFHRNLKNANDVISLRPFIALLAYSFKDASEKHVGSNEPILPGRFFTKAEARQFAAEAHLNDILKDYDESLTTLIKTMHSGNNPKLEPYRQQTISKDNLEQLIENVFELSEKPGSEKREECRKIISLLEDAGIIRQNALLNGVSYSFAFLYKYYLRLKGNPQS